MESLTVFIGNRWDGKYDYWLSHEMPMVSYMAVKSLSGEIATSDYIEFFEQNKFEAHKVAEAVYNHAIENNWS